MIVRLRSVDVQISFVYETLLFQLQNEVQVMNHEYKCLAQQPNIRNPPGNRLKIKTCDDNNLQVEYVNNVILHTGNR